MTRNRGVTAKVLAFCDREPRTRNAIIAQFGLKDYEFGKIRERVLRRVNLGSTHPYDSDGNPAPSSMRRRESPISVGKTTCLPSSSTAPGAGLLPGLASS